jgi:hypothetical protein
VIWKAEALLFPEKKSGLVRLSDATKIGLQLCAETTAKVLAIYSQGEPHYSRAREIARRVEEGKVNTDQADEQIRQILASIPLVCSSNFIARHFPRCSCVASAWSPTSTRSPTF